MVFDRRLATEDELEFFSGDEFFQPQDLSFVTQPVAPAVQANASVVAPPAPVATAPTPTFAPPKGVIFEGSPEALAARYEHTTEQGTQFIDPYAGLSTSQNLAGAAPVLGFTGEALYDPGRASYQGSLENYSPAYELTPEYKQFLSERGYQFGTWSKPGVNGQYFGVFDPTGKPVPGTEQFQSNENRAWDIATGLLSAAAGNIAPLGFGVLNTVVALDRGDIVSAALNAANLAGVPVVKDITKTVSEAVRGVIPEEILGSQKIADIVSGVVDDVTKQTVGAAITGKDVDIGSAVVNSLLNQGLTEVAQEVGVSPKTLTAGLKVATGKGGISDLYNLASAGVGAISDISRASAIEEAYQDPSRALDVIQPPAFAPAEGAAGPPTVEEFIEQMSPAPVVAAAPVQTDTYTEDFESAIPDVEPEEPAPPPFYDYTYEAPSPPPEPAAPEPAAPINTAPALSEPVITPEEVLTPEAIQQLIPEAPPEVIQQIIEQIAPQYTPEPEYAPEPVAEPPIEPVQQVEVTGVREPIVSPVSVEEILSQGVEPPPPLTLEQILGPALEAPPQQVEVTGAREPVYTPAPIPSPVSVEEILNSGIEQPTFTTLEDILGPSAEVQRVETTGQREEPTPEPTIPEAPRTFNVQEGEVPRIEITGNAGTPGTELATPIINVDDILREGIEQGPPPTIEEILGTEPVSAPAPSPAPAPAPSPSPAPAPAPAPKPSGPDYGALLAALMGALGNQQTKPEEYRVADVRRGVESGLRAIEGMYGSQDDLMRILRG